MPAVTDDLGSSAGSKRGIETGTVVRGLRVVAASGRHVLPGVVAADTVYPR